MAEHAADGLDVHTILQRYGREGVAEVMESDAWQTCPFQWSFHHLAILPVANIDTLIVAPHY